MYGSLIQLNGEKRVMATWRRVPIASKPGPAGAVTEARLQELLFRHADILPLGEVDPAYDAAVPVCMELGTRAGPADALYLTPTGRIVLAEFKLWRNPGARREVVGQVLDYAGVLASWTYADLDREVRRRVKRSPFEIVSEAHGGIQEHVFVDRVARNLRRGEFLLLIIGDGIRESVEDIVSHVQAHSGLRFSLALVEAAVFRRKGGSGRQDGGEIIIQPRVLAKTELLPRTILVRKSVPGEAVEETDDYPVVEHDPPPLADANEEFWSAVLEGFKFDDGHAVPPQPSRERLVWLGVEGSGWGDAGLWFEAYLNPKKGVMGTRLANVKGVAEAARVFKEILRALQADEIDLQGWQKGLKNKRPRIGFWSNAEFAGGTELRDFDEGVDWMREHFNRLVSTLYPECRRRLRAKR